MGSDVNAQYVADETDPAKIIVELGRLFYEQGWMPGTAGGMSVQDGSKLYMTPSGVQKERMRPGDISLFDMKTKQFVESENQMYRPSACAPLFLAIHTITNAGACIHTHSKNSVLASMLFDEDKFRMSHIENIKAVPKRTSPGNLGFYDTLEIPIIENRAHEEELEEDLVQAIVANPEASAILVRRHGVFVWGENVWKAKVIHEALDYLFDLCVEMKKLNITDYIYS